MKVLLLSAYAARSHVYWQESLCAMFREWRWQLLSLPPRHFSWRVRGNPLYWAVEERSVLEGEYDLLIATSMVDLATLRGLVPGIADIPTVLYFHENQFAYPQHRQSHNLLEAQMVSLYASLAADNIVFNSDYNQRSFLTGCAALLKRLPDKVPRGIIEKLSQKSSVLPVPVSATLKGDSPRGKGWPGPALQYPHRPLRLVWVGRFEHDKGGENLLHCLGGLEKSGLDYELAMIGQRFRGSPAVFAEIESRFKDRLVQFGFIESEIDYRNFLEDADIVLSTALHEFQGIAVLEAVTAGCLPVVPERLVYPDIFTPDYCYPSQPEDPSAEGEGAANLVIATARNLVKGERILPDISHFSAAALQPLYEQLFLSLCRR